MHVMWKWKRIAQIVLCLLLEIILESFVRLLSPIRNHFLLAGNIIAASASSSHKTNMKILNQLQIEHWSFGEKLETAARGVGVTNKNTIEMKIHTNRSASIVATITQNFIFFSFPFCRWNCWLFGEMRSDARQPNEQCLVSSVPENIFQFTRWFSDDLLSSDTINPNGLLHFVTQTQINAIGTASNGHDRCDKVLQSQQLHFRQR